MFSLIDVCVIYFAIMFAAGAIKEIVKIYLENHLTDEQKAEWNERNEKLNREIQLNYDVDVMRIKKLMA